MILFDLRTGIGKLYGLLYLAAWRVIITPRERTWLSTPPANDDDFGTRPAA